MDKNQQVLVDLLSAAIRDRKPELSFTRKIDWEVIFGEAQAHQVEALIYPVLQKLDKDQILNKDLLDRWKHVTLVKSYQQIQHLDRIGEVLQAFNNENIPVIALKGLVLRDFYLFPELRTMCDADLLIHKKDLAIAKTVLFDMGYTATTEPNPKHIGFNHKFYPLIEIHWTLVDPGTVISSATLEDSIWQNTKPVPISGVQALSLSNEDQLLSLLLHMANHFIFSGFGLRNLCDLVELIENKNIHINWDYFLLKSKECNIEKFTLAIFLCCKKLFQINFPDLFDFHIIENDPYLNELQQDIFLSKDSTTNKIALDLAGGQLRTVNRGKNNKIQSKYKFLFSFLFPKPQKLEFKFQYAHKYPILYPIACFHRLFIGRKYWRNTSFSEKIHLLKEAELIAQQRSQLLQWLNLY